MNTKRFTKVPDAIIDTWMPELSESEFKVLMVIVRQTLGWDKPRDRISHSQFVKKTGLSQRAVTAAVESLSTRNLIRITDHVGRPLVADERRYRKDICYELGELQKVNNALTKAENNHISRQNVPITRDMYIQQDTEKKVVQPRIQSDAERIDCIIRRQRTGACSCFRCS